MNEVIKKLLEELDIEPFENFKFGTKKYYFKKDGTLIDCETGEDVTSTVLCELIFDYKCVVKVDEPDSVWDLKACDKYYFIDGAGYICDDLWTGCHEDIHSRDFDNAFLTYGEAENENQWRRIKTILAKHGGRKKFIRSKANWKISFDDIEQDPDIDAAIRPCIGCIYFDTWQQAEDAWKELKKLYDEDDFSLDLFLGE